MASFNVTKYFMDANELYKNATATVTETVTATMTANPFVYNVYNVTRNVYGNVKVAMLSYNVTKFVRNNVHVISNLMKFNTSDYVYVHEYVFYNYVHDVNTTMTDVMQRFNTTMSFRVAVVNDAIQQQMFSFMMFCMLLLLMIQFYHVCEMIRMIRTKRAPPVLPVPPVPPVPSTPATPPVVMCTVCKNKGTQVNMPAPTNNDSLELRSRIIPRDDVIAYCDIPKWIRED